MSVEQILKELPKLTPEERREIFEQLAELETQYTYRPTPEESAAIDEAIRTCVRYIPFRVMNHSGSFCLEDRFSPTCPNKASKYCTY